jgi:hypothetical protein
MRLGKLCKFVLSRSSKNIRLHSRSATRGQNYAYVWCGKDDPLYSEGGMASAWEIVRVLQNPPPDLFRRPMIVLVEADPPKKKPAAGISAAGLD